MHLGAVPFSLYATAAPEQLAFVLRDAGARVVVTERTLLPRLEAAVAAGAPAEHVVVVDRAGGGLTLAELESGAPGGFDFDATWQAVGPDDLLTLIYTSGTTGPPKGVELTHANALSTIRGLLAMRSLTPGGRTVSYLPSAHIADRLSSHYLAIVQRLTVTCCPDPAALPRVLAETRPTVFMAVPRVWEKLRQAVEPGLPDGWQERPAPAIAPVRARLGLDEVEVAVTAGAPISPGTLRFFHALGVPVAESYGLSENCAAATWNPPEANRIGTVGIPIPGVEVRLLGDGEVLIRGRNVMRGYRNRPDLTREAIDEDGWLHTGDVGVLDDDGYLRIVDRKKDLIINAAGKNMSPAAIEATLKSCSPLIAHACAIGDGRRFNVALITVEDGVDDPEGVVAAAVAAANERLSGPERIRRHRVLPDEWAPGGELTPTLKLRRRVIVERYAAEIEALYAQ